MSDADQHIAALLSEERVFEPRGGVRGPGGGPGPLGLRARRGRPRGVLGRAGRPAGLGQALGHGHDLGPPLGEVVRGRPAQRVLQLPRPARRGRRRRQGRVLLGGRARRGAGDHLPGAPRRRLPVRERPQGARRAQGRPGRDLPGHGPRAPGRDARVRSDRGAALGRLRWLLIGGPPRSHQRRRGQGLDHRRRWLSPRRRRAAEGQRGRGGPASARRSSTSSRSGGPAESTRSPRGGTSGTTTWSKDSRPSASPNPWTPSTRSTCSTRAGPPGSPRASCTRRAATSRRWPRRIG